MLYEKIADELVETYCNGNKIDAINNLFALKPGEMAVVSIMIGRDYAETGQDFLYTLYEIMGIN